MRAFPERAIRRSVAILMSAMLVLGLAAPVAAAELVATLTVDPDASLDQQTNELFVTGSADCDAAGSLEMQISATQQIGQHTVLGFGFGAALCVEPETTVQWTTTVLPSGSFSSGDIALDIFARSCTEGVCVEAEPMQVTVQARPTNNRPPPPGPTNDERAGAAPIAFGENAWQQDTSFATSADTDPTCSSDDVPFTSHTIWLTHSASATGWLEIDTFGSSYDTVVVVLQGDTIVGCNDDVILGEIRHSLLTIPVVAGLTYTLMIGSFADSPGGWLNVSLGTGVQPPAPPTAPANDLRSGAVALALDAAATVQTDIGAANANPEEDPADGDCGMPVNGDTVWYSVVGNGGWIEVNTLSSGYDTTLFVYSGTELVACNDQADSTNQSRVVFPATLGTTYHVMVGAWAQTPPGTLGIVALTAQAPLGVTLLVDAVGSVSGGVATITGTVTCDSTAAGVVFASIVQTGGRFVAEGGGEAFIDECSTTPTTWAIEVIGTSRFQNGTAEAFVGALMETETQSTEVAPEPMEVTLRAGH